MNFLQQIPKTVFMVAIIVIFSTGKYWPDRPNFLQKAKMARYLMRNADWGVLSIYSERFKNPFGYVQSFSDGQVGHSSGIPYFYVAKIADIHQDILHNNSATFFVSEAMSDFCISNDLDPEEPPCSRLMLIGKMVTVDDHKEVEFAKNGLFSRHPAMKGWPKGHGWAFYKLNLTTAFLLDFYGGGDVISLEDYFTAS